VRLSTRQIWIVQAEKQNAAISITITRTRRPNATAVTVIGGKRAARPVRRERVSGQDLGEFVVTQVLEKLGTTESTTLNVRREECGKIRVDGE
jgi:hypothetical protein